MKEIYFRRTDICETLPIVTTTSSQPGKPALFIKFEMFLPFFCKNMKYLIFNFFETILSLRLEIKFGISISIPQILRGNVIIRKYIKDLH